MILRLFITIKGNKFKQLVEAGLNELNNSSLKPEVKPCINEFQGKINYKPMSIIINKIDIAHDIDDDEFAEAEANEPWIQGVLLNLHNLLNNFKPRLSSTSFDQLVSYLTNTVASTLERAVLKTKFTRLGKIHGKIGSKFNVNLSGGLQFDRELRSLVNFLTGVTSQTVRDRFARLHQMNTVLNLEEPNEVFNHFLCNRRVS